jgi:septum formation protein
MQLILASQSPRRADLLREAGYRFEQVDAEVDEAALADASIEPHELALTLARAKATAIAERRTSSVVIGCDTLLNLDGEPIGKPMDQRNAETTLSMLFDRTHQAITAVACIRTDDGVTETFVDIATVYIHNPGDTLLQAYLASEAWTGKAGGYNLAELTGVWDIQITGDPNTVVGLPIDRLHDVLGRLGADSPHA